MELLTTQRTEYYLNAALAFLHEESTEWRMEVELWLDELVFFYKLIKQRKKEVSSPAETAEVEKELITLHSDKIERLRREIQHHESTLGRILKSESVHEENYRESHRAIFRELVEARIRMREFKLKIFRTIASC